MHPDYVLIKTSTSTDNSSQKDAQTCSEPITLLGKPMVILVLQATLPGGRGLSAWLVVFLENVLPLHHESNCG